MMGPVGVADAVDEVTELAEEVEEVAALLLEEVAAELFNA